VYTRGLAAGLVAAGHEVVYPPEGLFAGPSSYLANPLRSYRAARKLARLVGESKPDVIHFAIEPYATVLPFLPRSIPPVVITAHGTYAYFPQLLRKGLRRALARWMLTRAYIRAAKIICVSSYTRDALLAQVPMLAKKIDVIPNGVALAAEEIQARPRSGRAEFLLVGGVKARKGALEALETMAAYRQRYGSDFHFSIVGSLTDEPWYVERVRERLKALQLEGLVDLAGLVSDEKREEYYKSADAFIMLNISDGKEFEGFGLVYLEANAYGVPALGASGTAAEEAIKEGISGFLVDAHDARAAADALHRMVGSGALRKGAREWAEAHSWEAIAARYERVYNGLV